MRRLIAALQVTVDGFIEGPHGELDWAMTEDEETWRDMEDTLATVDTLILGRVMYPAYEQYWRSILANPAAGSPHEVAYARRAERTLHLVVSRTLDKVAWQTTRIVRDVEEIRVMKQQPGRDMLVLGGATLVSSLINLGLLDELHLMVNPLLLGGGKALFQDVQERRTLQLLQARPLSSGKVALTYRIVGVLS